MKKQLVFGLFSLLIGPLSFDAMSQQPASPVNAVYRATATKLTDLVHTKLDVSFDYSKRYLNGKAWLTVKPHFYQTDSLILDAQGMDIKTVALVGLKNNTPLKFVYNGEQIKIKLDKKYGRTEKYTVFIAYTAKPNELKASGSAAITDEKGLYFINPDGAEKDKPVQIWTQGEAESSSAWFPTIDKPNQKTTAEIAMTVLSKYVTLSNGKLVSQKAKANGTRTDTWKMDFPHAPYLFMMAVGDFKVSKELWKGKEVSYYLEPKYAPYAKAIFGKTPKMLSYFSQITGVDYPWNKYAQVVVRDYVSGAMENTTATIHGESVQRTDRELLDGDQESTIAHELFHHWFGDYVTAESWSNITVNESFATFGAIVWKGHDQGKDAEDRDRYESLNSYLSSTEKGESPILVRFHYANKMDVFDQVSYPKGAVILYALKNQMGDEAFYQSINRYLTTNALKTGEAHQVRLAFEEVTGKDWSSYFNQWYFAGGHPILEVKYGYKNGEATIDVKQTQAESVQSFTLPLKVAIYAGGKKTLHEVVINDRTQQFSFPVSSKPDLIDLDVDKILVGELKEEKTLDNYVFQYHQAPSYANRIKAVKFAAGKNKEAAAQQLLVAALNDQDDLIRSIAIKGLNIKEEKVKMTVAPILAKMAKEDRKSSVRAAALMQLAEIADAQYLPLAKAALNDRSYKVIGAGLYGIRALEPTALKTVIAGLDEDTKAHLGAELSGIYAVLGDDAYHDFYLQIANKATINGLAEMVGNYLGYLVQNTNPKVTQAGLQAIIANMDRTKLTNYWGKQFVQQFKNAEQAKLKAADKASGEAKQNLIQQAELFKSAAIEMEGKK